MRVFTDLDSLPRFRNAVITIGSFDGVHLGHRRILEKVQSLAKNQEGESVVITFDPHPRTVLKPDDLSFKLLSTIDEKTELLQQAGIDYVVVVPFSLEFSQQSAQQYVEDFLVKRFAPKYIVIGYDHRFGAGREGDIVFLKKFEKTAGFEVVEISAQEVDEIAISSSKIRKALESSDLKLANRLLGHAFSFSGKVVVGNKIGRTLGFPTANIEIADPYKLVLPEGIYAAQVAEHKAALYIGNRPTLSPDGKRTIEVNILDFEGDLYGQQLKVEVLDFIRPDKKLDNLEDLKRQIGEDKREIELRFTSYDLRGANYEGGSANTQPSMPSGHREPSTVNREPSTVNREPSTVNRLPSTVNRKPSTVAVVILNYNTRRHLEQFLPSVVENSPGARIIVADNGSPDDSIEFLQQHYPEIELIDLQQNWGFAEGYNRALQQVQAEIYVILNSDVEVAPNWLEPVLDAMKKDPGMAVAQPKILAWEEPETVNREPETVNREPSTVHREPSTVHRPFKFEYAGASGGWIDRLGYPFCRGRIFSQREEDHGQYDEPQECFWATGAAFFIRAELYHTFGGFDGDYFAHNEEIDLCWRLKRAGYGIWCIPQSVVWHLGGGTLEYENPRKVFLNFRNSLYSLLKNEPWGKLLWLIPARFLLDGLAGARFAAKSQFKAIWAIVRAHFSFYGNFGKTLQKRRKAQQIIEKHRIAPKNQKGIYPGSIIIAHYLRRIKVFSKL